MALVVPCRLKLPLATSEPEITALSAVKVSEVAPPQATVDDVVIVASDEAVKVVVPESVVVVLVRVVVAPRETRIASAESVMSLPRTRRSPFTSST